MVLKAFGGSLGLLLGALGGLLGVSWELLRACGSTEEGLQNRLGTPLGFVCSRLAAEVGLGAVWGVFGLFLVAPKTFQGVFWHPSKRLRQ